MNVQSMHDYFKVGFDKTDSLNYPGFEPEEIDLWLNMAQDRLVKTRYGGNNLYRKGFEESQKRTDDLRTIVRQAVLSPQSATILNKPNGFPFNVPNSPSTNDVYWFSIQEEVNILVTDCNNVQTATRLPVKAITHDQYNKIIRDPFNKPDSTEVVRLFSEGQIEVISPIGMPTSLIIRYVRKPQRIDLANSVDCELPDHIHSEVGDTAIQMALENIESVRTRSNTIELNTTE